jgi:hypothetical protein
MTRIKRKDVSTIAMVEGGETRISKVVVDGRVMEWVGIGWIDVTDTTTPAERRSLPVVEDAA